MADYQEDAAWLREHLWELHAPKWEARITRILDACDAMLDRETAALIVSDYRQTWPPELPEEPEP